MIYVGYIGGSIQMNDFKCRRIYLKFLYSVIIGLVVSILHLICGNLVMDRFIEIFGHEKILEFMYVITVMLVGIFLLILHNTKNKKISDALLSGLAIF